MTDAQVTAMADMATECGKLRSEIYNLRKENEQLKEQLDTARGYIVEQIRECQDIADAYRQKCKYASSVQIQQEMHERRIEFVKKVDVMKAMLQFGFGVEVRELVEM